jgi:hypothetical protein
MYLLYSREARLPAEGRRLIFEPDSQVDNEENPNGPGKSMAQGEVKESELTARCEVLNVAADKAFENIAKAQEQQKRDYKRRRGLLPKPCETMPAGSMVLMKVPSKHKLSAGCEGPYRLLEYQSDTRVVLEDSVGTVWPCHVNRISPYTPSQSAPAKAPHQL